jgi:DNA replication protein DnaC
MLNMPTVARMRQMGLSGMADALERQEEQGELLEGATFEERLGLLIDAEWSYQEDKRLQRRLRDAHLRLPAACLEDLDLRRSRGLDKRLMRTLAEDRWVREHVGLLITGPTGIGKTYVACAVANAALRRGHSARYYRVGRLLEDLHVARGTGTWTRQLGRLARYEVLVLDEFGLAPLTAAQGRDLLEVIDDRSGTRSTVIASQLPVDDWHDVIQDPTVADAMLDRTVHHAYRITMEGESMRRVHDRVADVASDGAD